jgi:hypothetical protein
MSEQANPALQPGRLRRCLSGLGHCSHEIADGGGAGVAVRLPLSSLMLPRTARHTWQSAAFRCSGNLDLTAVMRTFSHGVGPPSQ